MNTPHPTPQPTPNPTPNPITNPITNNPDIPTHPPTLQIIKVPFTSPLSPTLPKEALHSWGLMATSWHQQGILLPRLELLVRPVQHVLLTARHEAARRAALDCWALLGRLALSQQCLEVRTNACRACVV